MMFYCIMNLHNDDIYLQNKAKILCYHVNNYELIFGLLLRRSKKKSCLKIATVGVLTRISNAFCQKNINKSYTIADYFFT